MHPVALPLRDCCPKTRPTRRKDMQSVIQVYKPGAFVKVNPYRVGLGTALYPGFHPGLFIFKHCQACLILYQFEMLDGECDLLLHKLPDLHIVYLNEVDTRR
jgi:hypothetical protein